MKPTRQHLLPAVGAVLAAGLLYAFFWWLGSGYVLNLVAKGGRGWPEMSTQDLRLSHAMRTALLEPLPAVHAGAFTWRSTAPGFEVAELPVLTDQEEIDRIYLARVDPRLYAFEVHTGGGRQHSIKDWEKALPAASLIVNGSFFGPHNEPDTPLISNGRTMGPRTYEAKAGVFVADDIRANVVDLTSTLDWRAALAPASNAMVAYPLLIGDDGRSHVAVKSRWLSNRTFVAEDKAGRIVIGSTREAFFSLEREADFLRAALPDLKTALNLDGGPVACQSVRSGGLHRLHIARWEAQVKGDRAFLLHWQFGLSDMPVVLAVTAKS